MQRVDLVNTLSSILQREVCRLTSSSRLGQELQSCLPFSFCGGCKLGVESTGERLDLLRNFLLEV